MSIARMMCIINWRARVDQRSVRRVRKYKMRWHWLRKCIWMAEPLIWFRVNASMQWCRMIESVIMMHVLTLDGSAADVIASGHSVFKFPVVSI